MNVLLLACCMIPASAMAGAILLHLQRHADYDPGLPYQRAFAECELTTAIPKQVATSVARQLDADVVQVDAAGQVEHGLALAIRVVEIDAPGGGAWSGEKGLTVEGNLYQDSKVIDTIRRSHRSKGHSIGLIKATTCSILNTNTGVLADQLADGIRRRLWSLGIQH